MSEFGIYIGTEIINITEVQRKKPLVNFSIPKAKIFNFTSEQKNPDEKKIDLSLKAGALKEEFTKNNISPTSVNIALAGENLIIRTFDLPIFLSRKELNRSTIAFEAKKYMPFKIADLIFDYRLRPDRKNKKMLILFVGIKKELLEGYLAIFKELQIQVRSIEYAGFSLLRLLSLNGLKDKGIIGLLNVDFQEETNFLACQNGFPLFSRDITLISKSDAEEKSIFMGKLKSEIRISLDFLRRKFPNKPLDNLVILSLPKFQSELIAVAKDLGLPIAPLEISKILGNGFEFSPIFGKSFAVAVSKTQRLRFSINLLLPVAKKEGKFPFLKGLPIAITDVKIDLRAGVFAVLIIILSVGWGLIRRLPIENELKVLKANQPKIEGVSVKNKLKAIQDIEAENIEKNKTMENIVKNRYYLTKIMNVIPRILPKGAWLTSFELEAEENELEFTIEGAVFLNDSDKEFTAVNDIVLGLRNESEFSQRFKEILVSSMERDVLDKKGSDFTRFVIRCR